MAIKHSHDMINNWFICQHVFVKIWSMREGIAESNYSFLSALQTSQMLHISINAQLMHEPIVL